MATVSALLVWPMLTCGLFFLAEDGIRDHCVTGVQTCALPICPPYSLISTTLNILCNRGTILDDSTASEGSFSKIGRESCRESGLNPVCSVTI